MLPDDLMIVNKLMHPIIPMLYWKGKNIEWEGEPVLDTELLHLCWLVEETLNEINSANYAEFLRPITANYKLLYHATWQQRVIALAKVKGIEI